MVKITVSQKESILAGRAQWGEREIGTAQFELVLSELSLKERDRLKVYSNGDLYVEGAVVQKVEAKSTDVDDIVEAIRASIVIVERERAANREAARAKLNAIIAEPQQCFNFATLSRFWGRTDDDIKRTAEKAGVDPGEALEMVKACEALLAKNWKNEVLTQLREGGGVEINDRIVSRADVKEVATKRNMTEIIAIIEAREAADREAAAAQALRVEASKSAWAEWAKAHGSDDLKAAMEDGYPLGEAVEREVFEHLWPEGEAVDRVERSEDRRVPNAAARALKASLERAIVKDLDNIEGYVGRPEGVEMAVGRIQSIEIYQPCDCQGERYCDKCDDDLEVKVKRTAVPVTVRAPHIEATKWYLVAE